MVVDDMFGEVIHCVTRRKPRVLESRMQRVRMERRELHPAVGSVPDGFHCRPRAFDTGWQRCLHALGDVRLAYGQDHRDSHECHALVTPRLIKKCNYRIVWADGSKGPAKLQRQIYGHGPHARYNSWVILTPATGDCRGTASV